MESPSAREYFCGGWGIGVCALSAAPGSAIASAAPTRVVRLFTGCSFRMSGELLTSAQTEARRVRSPRDPRDALHGSRVPVGLLGKPGAARARVALRRPARLAARHDRAA